MKRSAMLRTLMIVIYIGLSGTVASLSIFGMPVPQGHAYDVMKSGATWLTDYHLALIGLRTLNVDIYHNPRPPHAIAEASQDGTPGVVRATDYPRYFSTLAATGDMETYHGHPNLPGLFVYELLLAAIFAYLYWRSRKAAGQNMHERLLSAPRAT